MRQPTILGAIAGVHGSTLSVRLGSGVESGIAIIGGRSYRLSQVGSFVRVPQGYHDLYGIVSEVGAQAAPKSSDGSTATGERWMTVQLVGEVVEFAFERGVSQLPSINDEVHLVTEPDLARIYASNSEKHVPIGKLSNSESISVSIDIEKFVTRHSAVLGSTGSGKSTAVASIMRSICDPDVGKFPSARILLIDIHGEYGSALSDVAKVFHALPDAGGEQLLIPYWALPPSRLLKLLMGNLSDSQETYVFDKIYEAKKSYAERQRPTGVELSTMTVETPLPYSLRQIWFDLISNELQTWNDKEETDPAIVDAGSAEELRPPRYRPAAPGGAAPFQGKSKLHISRQLSSLRSRLLDQQYDFLLDPGPLAPSCDGTVEQDLPALLESWIGHDKPITVLDLSGVPSEILLEMVGGILSIIYESLFWGRQRPEGGRGRPQLIVLEEAHRYLAKGSVNPAAEVVRRIVKEGRKFGIGAMIVSQRPSEIDETILSQCGTFVALRLTNNSDRAHVKSALADNLSGVVESLPILRTGEAILVGEASAMPVRCKISLPKEHHRPAGGDPNVAKRWGVPRAQEDYSQVVAAWRGQNPLWQADEPSPTEEE